MLAILSVFSMLAAGAVWFFFFYDRRNAAVLQAELDQTDPGWRMDDIWAEYQRTIPPDDKNSFLVVEAASKVIPPPFTMWSQKPESLLSVVKEEGKLEDGVPQALLTESRQQLKQARAALDIAHRLRAFNGLGAAPTKLSIDGMGTLIPHVDTVRKVCDLLQAEGTCAALSNDSDRALIAAICCVQAGRSIGDEPFFISQLIRLQGSTMAVTVAEQTLAKNVAKGELLAELQDRLAAEVEASRFLTTMRMERACLNQLYENFRTGKDTVGAFAARYGLNVPVSLGWQSVLFTLHEKGEHQEVLEHANQLVEAARQPEEKWVAQSRQIRPLPEPRSVVSKLLAGMGYRTETLAESDLSRVIPIRCAIAAIACERFRMRTEAWPKSLEELPKDLLPNVPPDPFTGQALKFKHEAGGVIVYSVGPDGEDNGGKLSHTAKPPPGTDLGFRLIDPKKRGGK
ncbi:hypothetical protein [Limnoglobus roseus]|nr:hypothetical protein [Limnoglobus roseus]